MALPSLLMIPLLLTLLSLLLSFSLLRRKKPAHELPPGPRRLPIIGNLHQLGDHPLHQSLFELSKEHGPLMFLKLGKIPTIVVSGAEVAKEFMKTHDTECCSRPFLTSTAKLTYNYLDIGFSPYGPHWREMRRISALQLKSVLLNESIRREEIERMITSISSEPIAIVNLSEKLHILATDITCRAAFSRRESSRLQSILEETDMLLTGFFYTDNIPALGWLDALTGMRARLEKNWSELNSFYDEVIEEHMDTMRRRQEDTEEDTLGGLLRIHMEDGTNFTIQHIKAILLNVLLGGSDTASSALEWGMSELMRSPQVMKKVQDEVRRVVGRKGKVEESDLPKLHYMQCVIKEVMRLHPPGPLLVPRETTQQFRVGEYVIPAKTRLIINAYAIGREEGNWEKAEVFDPERFVDNPIDMKGRDFRLIPFGAGRRICLGMQLGLAVVELTLAHLLYTFDWKLPEGMTKEDIDMEEHAGLAVHRKNALRLVATKYKLVDG